MSSVVPEEGVQSAPVGASVRGLVERVNKNGATVVTQFEI